MRQAPRPETPLDSKWLQLLSERCAELRGGGARFEDLYLEQRLEVRVVATNSDLQVESCRLEGAAARWRSPSRAILHARTGLSTSAIAELLGRQADRVSLPHSRPLPTAEMDPPRPWMEWAHEVADRLRPAPSVIRYLSRRAAVVRSDGWVPVALQWDQFHRVDWEAEAGTPFSKPDQVSGMAFGFSTYEATPNTGTIWVDEVQLITVQPETGSGGSSPDVEPVDPAPETGDEAVSQDAPPPPSTTGDEGGGGLPCLGALALPLGLVGIALNRRRRFLK